MTQWTKKLFFERLTAIMEKKGQKYQRNGTKVDVLAIVTDEPWLLEGDVQAWLSDIKFPKLSAIEQVDLVLSYQGGKPGNYPLFRLC